MPFGWRGVPSIARTYVRELWRLQTALTRRLRELRANAERRAKPESRSAGAAARNGEFTSTLAPKTRRHTTRSSEPCCRKAWRR